MAEDLCSGIVNENYGGWRANFAFASVCNYVGRKPHGVHRLCGLHGIFAAREIGACDAERASAFCDESASPFVIRNSKAFRLFSVRKNKRQRARPMCGGELLRFWREPKTESLHRFGIGGENRDGLALFAAFYRVKALDGIREGGVRGKAVDGIGGDDGNAAFEKDFGCGFKAGVIAWNARHL